MLEHRVWRVIKRAIFNGGKIIDCDARLDSTMNKENLQKKEDDAALAALAQLQTNLTFFVSYVSQSVLRIANQDVLPRISGVHTLPNKHRDTDAGLALTGIWRQKGILENCF